MSRKAIVYPAYLETADNRCYFGGQGSGKGFRFLQVTEPESRLVIWDYQKDMARHGKRMKVVSGSLLELSRLLRRENRFRVCFQPNPRSKDLDRDFDLFCEIVAGVGRMACGIDEANMVIGPQFRKGSPLLLLTGQARHAGIRSSFLCHRPAEMNKNLMSNASTVISGIMDCETSLKHMRTRFGVRTPELVTIPNHHQIISVRDNPMIIKDLAPKAKPKPCGPYNVPNFI